MVHRYLCNKSSISVRLERLCATGLMDTLLDYTCPNRVAKQVGRNDACFLSAITKDQHHQEDVCVFFCLFFTTFLSAFLLCFLYVCGVLKGHLPFLSF